MVGVFPIAEETPYLVLLSQVLVNANAEDGLRNAVVRAIDKIVGPAGQIRGGHVLQHGLRHLALAANWDLVIGEWSVVAAVRLLRGIEDLTEVQRHLAVARVGLGSRRGKDRAAQRGGKIKGLPVAAELGGGGNIRGHGSAGVIEQLLVAEQKKSLVVSVVQTRYP